MAEFLRRGKQKETEKTGGYQPNCGCEMQEEVVAKLEAEKEAALKNGDTPQVP